jgi:peptidoglycan/xylan/chitin deacetylase (PgdA/CDA1 family)
MRLNVRFLRLLLAVFIVGIALGLVIGLVLGRGRGTATARTVMSAPERVATSATTAPTSSNATSSTRGTTTSSSAAQGTVAPITVEAARALGANELGRIPVLMYHRIADAEETDYYRRPDSFRRDIVALREAGYYPITVRELCQGHIDVPAGRSPAVLTFDDSSPGQYRILEDGTLDPDCAVGIMQAAVAEGGWASKAGFFPLLYVDPPGDIVFGQPEKAREKLRQLVRWGYEVGSHTVTHQNLKKATSAQVRKELAASKAELEEMIGGGYSVFTVCIPFGEYPADDSLLRSGDYQGQKYSYGAALEVSGSSAHSPFSSRFHALHVPRIAVHGTSLTDVISHFQHHPEQRFVSDGDPSVISVPERAEEELGTLVCPAGLKVIRY